MNIFGTVLTYSAPSSNYRGESAENRSVIQKITDGRLDYAIMSPEALRNALRDTFSSMGLQCNRERLEDREQLAVRFEEYPDEDKYVDDFFMGWLIAAGSRERNTILQDVAAQGRDPAKFSFRRDSVLRMNMAVAIEPYRHNTVFSQSPLNVDSPWRNADKSQLLHRETSYTAFQYPFALSVKDCEKKEDWARSLLKAIGQLNNAAGNHARSYFEMAPASIVVRLTSQLVAGYSTYGFEIEKDRLRNREERHLFPEVVEGIVEGDYPANEFYLGGKLVKDMGEDTFQGLEKQGVTLCRNPQKLLETVACKAFPEELQEGT